MLELKDENWLGMVGVSHFRVISLTISVLASYDCSVVMCGDQLSESKAYF